MIRKYQASKEQAKYKTKNKDNKLRNERKKNRKKITNIRISKTTQNTHRNYSVEQLWPEAKLELC